MSSAQVAPQTAPVVLLVFNRPQHTDIVARRVAQAQPRAVYVVADGPRADHPDDELMCQAVRDVIADIDWDCPVHTDYAEHNLGLKTRVSSGLDWVFDHEDQAIILEDDCLPDPSFFPYATELLERYGDDPRMGLISGNNFLRGHSVDDNSYYFSPDMRIWGWATWARVWHDFSRQGLNKEWSRDEASAAVSRIQSPARQKNLIREAERVHRVNSWALPFVLHAQHREYLSAVPEKNLVTNIGFGSGSTHTKFESFTAEVPTASVQFPLTHPEDVRAHPTAGQLEARLERREWLTYPLRHPVDVLGRIWRYLRGA